MPDVIQDRDVFVTRFRELQKRTGASEPAWLCKIREEAMERYAEMGFPNIHQEAWKYTSLTSLARVVFPSGDKDAAQPIPSHKNLESLLKISAHSLVFVNGRLVESLSSVGRLPTGVSVSSLAQAVAKERGVEENLARFDEFRSHPFVAMNTACWQDGAFIRVAKGTVAEEPIHLIFVSSSGGQPVVSHPRVLILTERDTQAAFIETYMGFGDGVAFSNAVTELVAGEHSVISHYKIQNENVRSFHLATMRVAERQDANVTSYSISIGAHLARNEVRVSLDGEGCECTLNGLYLAVGKQHVDNSTVIDHAKPHGTSRQFYKGVLNGEATAAFNGRIIVRKDAQKTDATQQNKNLLLSPDALVDTTPQLEILADDVRCTHGATIGQIDPEAMFYLQSRAIGESEARAMLTQAFASEILNAVHPPALRDGLTALFLSRLFPSGKSSEVL